MHRFNYIQLRNLVVAFFALIVFAGATVSYAQTYTLTIREGNVYVNGKQLPRNEIPASLDAETIEASLTFNNAVFELEGTYYKIENNKLFEIEEPAEARDDRTTVIFRQGAPAAGRVATSAEAAESAADNYRLRSYSASGNYEVKENNPNMVMQQYVFTLSQNARQLNEMSGSVTQPQARDLIRQVQYQAEQAAQLAQDLPYLEMQNYFSSVRSEDELLYRRLVNELELERETQRLAAEVRSMPQGEARDFKVEELRELLASILELKQENRRLEISQLEKQLAILKQRFEEREAKKDRMIDRRIKELVGEH